MVRRAHRATLPGASATPGEITRIQIRGSGLMVAGQAFALITNLAVQILIVRYLSKTEFGVFAYALSIATVVETISAFGLHRSVVRFVPIFEERGELAKAAGMVLFSLVTILSIGLVLVLLVVGLRSAIAGAVTGEDAVAVLVILVALAPLQALGTLLEGLLAAFTRPRAIVARRFVLAPLLRLAVVALLAVSQGDVMFLAWGFVASGLLGLVIFVPVLPPVLRQHGLIGPDRDRPVLPAREVLWFTATLFTTDLTASALVTAGPIVVGALATTQEVASLRAVIPVVATMSYVLLSFGRLFWPLASRLYSRGDAEELNRIFWRTTTFTTVLAFPIFITTLILAEPLTVLLFGDRYESSAPVLAVLALGQYANTASGPNGELLGVFGRIRFLAATNVFTIAMVLLLMLVLVPGHGAIGAAVATTITYVIVSGVRQAGIGRRTPVHAIDPHYASVWLVALLVAGASFGLTVAVSLPTPIVIVIAVLAWFAVLASARGRLQILETFPELRRLPVLGRISPSKRQDS